MKRRNRLHPLAYAPLIVAAIAVAWLALWLWSRSREHDHAFANVKCQSNMRQIGERLSRYAADNGGKLPPTLDDLAIRDQSHLHCPRLAEAERRSAGLEYSYEYVANDAVFLDDRQVWLFEAADRHGRPDIHVLFSNGQVESISLHEASQAGTGRLKTYAAARPRKR